MKNRALTMIAGCALLTLGMNAQSQSASRMTHDNDFLVKAAEGGMAEVELGRLAVSNSVNPKVKEFGQRMIDDHSRANEELKAIAQRKGDHIPTSVSAKDQATKDRLSKMSGAEFDRAYMEDMIQDHKADVSEFRDEAKSGTDPDYKAFAQKTLPTLESHLKLAQSTDSQIKK